MGRSMAREGLVPKYPIVLLPGLASSSLQVEEGNPEWVGEWIWLSLAKIGSQKFKTLFSSPTVSKRIDPDASDEGSADAQFRNEWVRHVCLQQDGCSDPPGIRVRPVPGKDGCAYLSPGALTNNLSYVMGPLIENLHEFGYTDSDLVAVPYDWRLPPHMLEERDGFFTQLRTIIEKTAERCQSPVVIVAHSMGNRVLQYFLHRLVVTEGDLGRQWIDRHVHSYVAVGAPFLGAPKIVRSLATGERMGMEALLRQEEGVAFIRSLGSTGMIMPMAQPRYFEVPREFVHLRGERSEAHLPITITQTLALAGASKQVENLEAYYRRNSVWGRMPDAPPVKRLFAIYGVNLDTEMFYFYRRDRKGELVFDRDVKDTADFQGYTMREGIGYETKDTVQGTLRSSTGLHGHRSGDGTVPYVSLNYCTEWRQDLELRIEELEGVEHREILNNRLFFRLLIEHVSEPLTLRQRRERETVVLGCIDDERDDTDVDA
ncbi:phospholipid:sterol acyl transferase [Acanthamoeba castellanii str. Neff]|uniref:Phospholipid:sterol acyl transferase n=1 Tax=Acanthamoeba castellanii (strain ATCC 30010 / Neff) TaxID=1257118 RepID=L8HBL0_ACACF|nr:phospholipid:sterol acyl transferase [Acanthamoeba castellanii str. Neff]ELR22939.1 phospholipid:sterol acyl transferase [Acanthamoeba castellanii str. Neff]